MRMIYLLHRYKHYLPLLPVLLIGAWFAYHNVFIQDDAYISYNYAKWYARGYGLVWYPGSTEFGYSNFLYTFMIGVAMLFRIPPEIASNIINSTCFIGCLVIAYSMAVRVLASRWLALLPVTLLATHHTFTAYATGGLETMWVTLLILLFYWHILTRNERPLPQHYLKLGTLAAIALLSRLDTALLMLPGYIFTFVDKPTPIHRRSIIQRMLQMRDAVIIPVVVTLGFLLCCTLAYGYALPNTFYVKMPDDDTMMQFGIHYLILYNTVQLYLPFLVPALIAYFCLRRTNIRRLGGFTLLLAAVLISWLCYIVYVGGDFMEFRFLVPVLAFYYLVVFRMLQLFIQRRRRIITALVFGGFLLANIVHADLFRTNPNELDFNQVPHRFEYAFVESTDSLSDWLTIGGRNWIMMGKVLKNLFYTGSPDDVKIAVGNAGALPYFSELPALDVLGLNTRAVLSNYNTSTLANVDINRPGHNRMADVSLLEKEKIVLNLAFPQALCMRGIRYFHAPNPVVHFPFNRHETLLLPLGNGCYMVADYITPHPKVEELLQKRVILRSRQVQSDCPDWLCLR